MVILGGWVFLMSEVPLYSLEQGSELPVASLSHRSVYKVTESIENRKCSKVVLQKSIPAQIRQRILYISEKTVFPSRWADLQMVAVYCWSRARRTHIKRFQMISPKKWLESRPESGRDCLICSSRTCRLSPSGT